MTASSAVPIATTAPVNATVPAAPALTWPASCTAAPSLAPRSPTPSWPVGFSILNAVPAALEAQFPTVYAGIEVAPAGAGESAAQANSHLVILETAHSVALEAEAAAAYPSSMTVVFRVVPRSHRCLDDLKSQVTVQLMVSQPPGAAPVFFGPDPDLGTVDVGVTACGATQESAIRAWFTERWGSEVRIEQCQTVPSLQ